MRRRSFPPEEPTEGELSQPSIFAEVDMILAAIEAVDRALDCCHQPPGTYSPLNDAKLELMKALDKAHTTLGRTLVKDRHHIFPAQPQPIKPSPMVGETRGG